MKKAKKYRFLSIGLISIVLALSTLLLPSSVYASGQPGIGPWSTSPNNLPAINDGSVTVENDGYIYVISGFSSAQVATVYYAPLNSDGSVGSWTTSPNSLPVAVDDASGVVYNGYVYIFGGYNVGLGTQNGVYSAALNPNGSVGTWNTLSSEHLPIAEDGATAAVNDGYVYLFGGYDGSYYQHIYYAQLGANGTLGAWTTSSTNLPQTMENEAAIVNNGYIYIIGGFSGAGPIISTVYYAPLNSNGTVGSWTTSPNSLPGSEADAAAYLYDGYVYISGGDEDGLGATDTTYYAQLNSDGSVGTWATSTNSLPTAVYGQGGVYYDGYVYSVGGFTNSSTVINDVYYASVLNYVAPGSGSSSSSSNSTSTSTPDTGYGTPQKLSTAISTLIFTSVIVIISGLAMLYMNMVKKTKKNIEVR